MTDENYKAASKRDQCEARIDIAEREQARTHRVQMMMLDIDGILTRYEATTADVLAAAQQMAVSAIGHLVNVGESSGTGSADSSDATASGDQVPVPSDSLHPLADAIAEQIRAALHARIDEGKLPDW